MAPRKVTKRDNSEVVDKATEVGDVSPPKRKKTVSKTANKIDEEKRLRTPKPRTAKLPKLEQTQNLATISTTARTTNKSRALPVVKEASKPNSRVKSSKKNEAENINAVNAATTKNIEEKETKKPRTKAVTKKAGTESKEEPKDRIKRKAKKDDTTENTETAETAEVITAKKRKPAPAAGTVPKETKPKAKPIKKTVDAKNKVSKTRVTNDAGESSVETTKMNKKTKNDTSAKPTRTLRGRGNKGTSKDISKDDQELKVELPLFSSTARTIGDNELHEVENDESDAVNSVQESKRGKNLKKKEVPQKKIAKAVARNAASNENVNAIKIVKETMSSAVMKKGRGKKGATATTAIKENGEKVSEDEINENGKILNMSEKDNDKENSVKEGPSEKVKEDEFTQNMYTHNITVNLNEMEN